MHLSFFCGTSLTPQQVSVLARHVREIVINYDPDAAGQKAARRSIELLLEQGLTVRILRLPGGLDPDDFVRKEGGEAYRGLLERAPYFWEHLVQDALGRDFEAEVTPLRQVAAGDLCVKCGGALESYRGIEGGHIFILGTHYSSKMNATYLDEKGESVPIVMGCY